MALRAMGVYALGGTALYSQIRTAGHIARFEALTADAAALGLAADADAARAAALQGAAARDSELGLERQAAAAELAAEAEREAARAAAEAALGDGYEERAAALRERGAADGVAAAQAAAAAGELRLRSEGLRVRAEEDRAAAAVDEERAAALAEKAARAGALAAEDEEQAAGYEAVAIRKEGLSVKDGEAALKTEAGALEDAEVMAACLPVPLLDIFCEALGAIIESGAQGLSLFEGAKSGIETLSAAAAQRKERVKLAAALEEHEEEARLAAEAEKYQSLAGEEGARATAEEGEADAAAVEAGEEERIGEERSAESEREEALAAVDQEQAEEHYAKAAQDESLALEEESLAVTDQAESEELLAESTSEELESLAVRAEGEAEGVEAERILQRSVGHGLRAFGWMLHAAVTATVVVCVVAARGVTRIVAPVMAKAVTGEPLPSAERVAKHVGGFIVHATAVLGTIASMPHLLSKDMPPAFLLQLALVASLVESLGVHSTCEACSCHAKGLKLGPTIGAIVHTFMAKFMHLMPVVLMELLIVVTIFGSDVFDAHFSSMSPVGIWIGLLVATFIMAIASRALDTKLTPGQSSVDEAKQDCTCASVGQQKTHEHYGSMEEANLLYLKRRRLREEARTHDVNTPNYLQRYIKAFYHYCDGLRLYSDLLVLSLLTMLLWHCWPVLKILHPLVKTAIGSVASWVSIPILSASVLVMVAVVYFLLVR